MACGPVGRLSAERSPTDFGDKFCVAAAVVVVQNEPFRPDRGTFHHHSRAAGDKERYFFDRTVGVKKAVSNVGEFAIRSRIKGSDKLFTVCHVRQRNTLTANRDSIYTKAPGS